LNSNQQETTLPTNLLEKPNFPELPLYIISSLLFLDVGIFLGALNSFRFQGFDFLGWVVKPEIHQIHWTSTLLGGVTFMMLGQMYFFFSQINGQPHKYHRLTILVWVFWIVGITASFLSVWEDYDTYIPIVNYSFRIGSLIYVLLLAVFFLESRFVENFKQNYSLIFFPAAAFWLLVAFLLNFDISPGASLNRMFLFTYIYGFFSMAFFGSLSFVLPILFKQKHMNRSTIRRYFILLNLAAIIILTDLYLIEEKGYSGYFGDALMDFLGPGLWGLAGFLFTLWVFDLMYKSGMNPSLLALLVALMMFGFFVIDTFMKNVFPSWIDRSHFHFLFIGTLLITIIAIGTRIIVMQYNPNTGTQDSMDSLTLTGSSGLRTVGLIMTIIGVSGVLLGFTLEDYKIAGWLGIFLFFGLILVEVTLIYQLKFSNRHE
jgi:hypothetical protein